MPRLPYLEQSGLLFSEITIPRKQSSSQYYLTYDRKYWDSYDNLLSSLHTLLVNILRCVRLYIKRNYYYIIIIIYSALGKSQVMLLILFDMSSVFYMVDHDILLRWLELACTLHDPLSVGTVSFLWIVLRWISLAIQQRPGFRLSSAPYLTVFFTPLHLDILSKHSASGHLHSDDILENKLTFTEQP